MGYDIVVIDPPWQLDHPSGDFNKRYNRSHGGKLSVRARNIVSYNTIKEPYETMSDKEILDFDLESFCNDRCSIFIWFIQSRLKTALQMAEQIPKMKYRAILTWEKHMCVNINGLKRNTEMVLYAGRGKVLLNYSKGIKTGFSEMRREHSRKPEIFYEMLRNATQGCSRIDVFGRYTHMGFDHYGNEKIERNYMDNYLISQ